MDVSREQVLRIALLAGLSLTDREVELYQTQLSAILEHVSILKALEEEPLAPAVSVSARSNVVRQDVVAPSLSRVDALQNAPSVIGHHIEVKAVLEESK